jgi:hypothetical protein
VGRLCTREKYLRIKEDAHELLWGISAFLLGKSKSLRKGLVDLSPVKIVKEEGRGEREFRVPEAGNCLFDNISFISSLRIF